MLKKYLQLASLSLALSLTSATTAFAQTPAASAATPVAPAAPVAPVGGWAFEVASIKPAIPLQEQAMSGKMHVGVNFDKARVDIGAMALTDLIGIAYKVKPHQISGPDWLNVERFDILAKIPEGATKDQMPEMLQALLKERFKLTFHKDLKDHAIYALIVGKGGLKLKESPPDPEPPKEGDAPPPPAKEQKGVTTMTVGDQKMEIKQTANGGAEIKTGAAGKMKMTMVDGHMRMEMEKMTMAGLAEALSRFVDKPVVDMTDIKGNYQLAIELSMEDLQNVARAQGMQIPGGGPAGAASNSRPADTIADPSGSSVFSSVQQMGLKLESRKSPIDTIFIDHVEKTPTEN
jgi:uncharacterized protein (TIGR03435 family)